MQFLAALLLLALMAVCCWGPGFLLVRRLGWSRQETICAAIGASLIVMYLASTVIYLSGISWKWSWLVSLGCAAATAWTWRDTQQLLRLRLKRRELAGFAFLLLTCFLLLSITRHYSGGRWSGDWIEHFRRMEFFLDRADPQTQFINLYLLPARPPMMNLLAAFFAAHGGRSFDLFQIMFMVLNLLVYFPCVLLAGLFVRRGGGQTWLLAALMAASPVVMQNATWTWTKLLAAFFVVLSLAFYLRGWKKNDPTRIIAAAVAMAAGLLVHYSAGPYALAIVLHYPFIFLQRKHKWLETAGSAVAGIAMLSTWFVWSIAIYGAEVTFRSNTAVADSQKLSVGENLWKAADNVMTTIVPHPFRLTQRELQVFFDQPNPYGFVRDAFFMVYQVNLPLTLGLVGWAATLWLLARQLKCARAAERSFWIAFLCITIVFGVAVHGKPDNFGLAHICLLPLTLMGLTLLAAGFRLLPRWVSYTVAVAMTLDATVGVLLHFRMQMHSMQSVPSAGIQIVPLSDGLLSLQAVINSVSRHSLSLVYWADHWESFGQLLFIAAVVLLGMAVFIVAKSAAARETRRSPALSWFPAFAVGLYVCLATLIASDRWLGYSVADAPPWPADLTANQVAERLAPIRRAVDAAPHDSARRYELGKALYGAGKVDEAADQFLDAFLLAPENREARYALSLVLASHGGSLARTDAIVAEKVRVWPDDVDAQCALAMLNAARGHAEVARRRLENLVHDNPESPTAHYALAVLLYQMRDLAAAIEQCKVALSLKPDATNVATDLRTIMSARGDDSVTIEKTIRDIRAGSKAKNSR